MQHSHDRIGPHWLTDTSPALVNLTYYHALMYVYEADLINPLVRSRPRQDRPVDHLSQDTLLSRCLYATRGYLETFLTISTMENPHLSFNQWIGHTYATVLLYKLCLHILKAPRWDPTFARALAPFPFYIERFIILMTDALETYGHGTGGQEVSCLYLLHVQIWKDTLAAFLRKQAVAPCDGEKSGSMEVHRRLLGGVVGGNSEYGHAQASVAKNFAKHPCPAHAYWT